MGSTEGAFQCLAIDGWVLLNVEKPYQKNNNNLGIIGNEGQKQNRVNYFLKKHS